MTVPELTPIEKLIVLRVVAGERTTRIAADLGVAPRTVEWHLARSRQKLGRMAAVHECVRDAGSGAPAARGEGGER